MGVDQEIRYTYKDGEQSAFTYRKSNWLREWMCQNTELTQYDNRKEVMLDWDNVEELCNACEKVIYDPTLAEEEIPTCGGVYFGPTNYGRLYFTQVNRARIELNRLLINKDNIKSISYYDSW